MNQLLQHYAAHQDAVNSISIHPSGDYMVSASSDMTTKVIHSTCMTYLIWERAAARAMRRSIVRVGSNAGRGNNGGPICFPSCVWTYPDDARLLRRGAPPGRAPDKYPHSCKPSHFSSNTHNTIPTTKPSRFGTCAKVTCAILYMAMSVACRPLPFHQPATILRPALQTRTYWFSKRISCHLYQHLSRLSRCQGSCVCASVFVCCFLAALLVEVC